MYPSSLFPNSGVAIKIEEIEDEDKPENGDDLPLKLKKKKQVAHLEEKDSKSSQLPIVVRGQTDHSVVESEIKMVYQFLLQRKVKDQDHSFLPFIESLQEHRRCWPFRWLKWKR